MVYTVREREFIGDRATIVTHGKDGENPVLHLIAGQADFPGDVGKLAANLASLLNGNKPLHDIDLNGAEVFWRTVGQGVELRIKEADLTSRDALFAYTNDPLTRDMLGDPALMSRLCDTMSAVAPSREREPLLQTQPAF